MSTTQPNQPQPQPDQPQPDQPDQPDPDQDQLDRQFPSATVGGEGRNTPDDERYQRREDEKDRRGRQEDRGAET